MGDGENRRAHIELEAVVLAHVGKLEAKFGGIGGRREWEGAWSYFGDQQALEKVLNGSLALFVVALDLCTIDLRGLLEKFTEVAGALQTSCLSQAARPESSRRGERRGDKEPLSVD